MKHYFWCLCYEFGSYNFGIYHNHKSHCAWWETWSSWLELHELQSMESYKLHVILEWFKFQNISWALLSKWKFSWFVRSNVEVANSNPLPNAHPMCTSLPPNWSTHDTIRLFLAQSKEEFGWKAKWIHENTVLDLGKREIKLGQAGGGVSLIHLVEIPFAHFMGESGIGFGLVPRQFWKPFMMWKVCV